MITEVNNRPCTSTQTSITPVIRELPADLETPVSVYLKLAKQGPSFLLESVTGGEHVARYSFIGVNPKQVYIIKGGQLERIKSNGVREIVKGNHQQPLEILRNEISEFCYTPIPGLPRFTGGLVGFLSYDAIRYFEPSVSLHEHADIPDAIFLQTDTLVAFDHAFGKLLLIANVNDKHGSDEERIQAEIELDELEYLLSKPLAKSVVEVQVDTPEGIQSNVTPESFINSVKSAKEYIAAGDIFQVVLSQRFFRKTQAEPFDIYRALRRLNPSPYMYYFDFAELAGDFPLRMIGTSPEMHVRLEGRKATVRPIAGTRKRGNSHEEDEYFERELLSDAKERAEHVMLVDLARNDLGRVCNYGSVVVPEFMGIERYSHVMHIVSQVEGDLRSEYDAFDLLRVTFPAGTVSGAPKIRAMQIIQELEGESRGPYAGAVGYFSYDGALDTCITIRTLVMVGDEVSVQAGAGIVADSEPQNEFQETINKASALFVAVDQAEKIKI